MVADWMMVEEAVVTRLAHWASWEVKVEVKVSLLVERRVHNRAKPWWFACFVLEEVEALRPEQVSEVVQVHVDP